MRTLVATLVLTAALTACGGKHPGEYTAATAATAPATSGDAGASRSAEADALWEQRLDGAKLEAALAAYEQVLAAEPTNRNALEKLVRGWYFYGDAYTDDKDVKLDRWGKAIGYGARCLALNPAFAERIAQGTKEKDAVAVATKDDVPCLYWTSSALGKWGKAQGLSTTLKHLPTVKAYMSKVEELDPTFFHYGPARYWGAYYAALPSFAGRDLDKSASYFQASIDGAPNYLATRVLRAEYLHVGTQNAAKFEEDLNAVIAADANVEASLVPENTKAQEMAKALLARKAELFANADAGTQ